MSKSRFVFRLAALSLAHSAKHHDITMRRATLTTYFGVNAGKLRFATVLFLVTLMCVVALSKRVHAQEFTGDITCGGKQRFAVPGACLNSCSKQKRTLANFSGGLCFLSAACPAYDKTKDTALPQLYNQAMFGRGAVTGQPGKLVLASYIINTYYKPNNVRDIAVVIGSTPGGDDFAEVEKPSRPGGKALLTIQDDLFFTAPGYLISSIGHEMVHLEQLKRIYKTNLGGINSLVGAMRELEASSWELGADTFSRSIGPNQVGGCEIDQEKKAQQMTYACRQWQVKKAIEDIRGGARKDAYFKSIENWLNEDHWANQVWLQNNPDWKTQKAGAKPQDECSNP